MKILYIDDNWALTDSVKKLLRSNHVVDCVPTGRDGIERASATHYNLILLDLGLPDIDGQTVCYELRRARITTPILILTVQKDPLITAQLLNSGADDYVTKPFNGEALKARVAALLRRNHHLHDEKVLRAGELSVNVTQRQVQHKGTTINLRRKEFDILEYMMRNRGRALTRNMILDQVWEAGQEGWNNTIDVHIKHLRDKIDRPFGTKLIKTAYGIGYILDDTAL